MLEVEKRGELFVGTDDESLSISAVRVCRENAFKAGQTVSVLVRMMQSITSSDVSTHLRQG